MLNEISPKDLLEVLTRRKALVAGCALVALAAGALASTVAPRVFRATTRIEVRSVQGVDSRDIVDKARGVQEALRNRVTFDHLVGELGLDARFASLPPEERAPKRAAFVDALIAATPVTVTEPTGGLFYIKIENGWTDPDTAYAVCQGLANSYRGDMTQKPIEDQKRVVAQLTEELAECDIALKAAEQALQDFESKNKDLLFGSDAKRQDVLAQIRQKEEVEIPQLTERLRRAGEDLSHESRFIENAEDVPSDERLTAIDKAIRDVQAALREMQLVKKWTDLYPDVVAKKAELADLEAERTKLEATVRVKTTKTPNPTWNLLMTEKNTAESLLDGAQRQLRVLNTQLAEIRDLQDKLPPVKRQQEALGATKASARLAYDEKQRALQKADDQLGTYAKDRAVNFTVVDPAQRPRAPSGGGPALYAAGGLAAGLLLGCGIAYVLNMQDRSFREVDTVTAFLGIPTLGAIHLIETEKDLRLAKTAQTKRLATLGLLAVVSLATVAYAINADGERTRAAVGTEK